MIRILCLEIVTRLYKFGVVLDFNKYAIMNILYECGVFKVGMIKIKYTILEIYFMI